MRPVERGECPKDESGQVLVFKEYAHARPVLIAKLGDYCCFCEMPLGASLAVEHIRHKHRNPTLECKWENLLLACTNCNSNKGTKVDTQSDVDERLWPHMHRTFDVFVYGPGGVVRCAEIEAPDVAKRAEATEKMIQLCRRPGAGLTRAQVLSGSDRRWQKRKEAWDEAVVARDDLLEQDTPAMRRQILTSARARGFWSVWMTVFRDDEAMQRALCQIAFTGTACDRVYPVPSHVKAQFG